MDFSNLQNTLNKLRTIKGNSFAGTIALACLGILMVILGFSTFGSGVLGSLVLIVFGAGMTFVMLSSIPKEKKQIAESWAKLTPQEAYNIELAAPSAPVVGTAFVTPDALVLKLSQGPFVIPARDILWVYGKQVTQKMYGLVTTGKTFSTIVVDREGNRHQLNAKETTSEEQLHTLFNIFKPKYPGMIFGYRQELEALATKESIGTLAQYVDSENLKARS